MNVDSLVIEVTRKCNLKCSHCLRGDAQNIDIDEKHIGILFSKLDYINLLTISGGEPSLVPKKINKIVSLAKKHNVGIGNFYIATNAKEKNSTFILAIINLYAYCSDNEISQVNWSNDGFHENGEDQIELLSVLKFASAKYENYAFSYAMVLKQGRSKNGSEVKPYFLQVDDDSVTEGEVYLNCIGEIISGCDWSYKNQAKHKICNVEDFSLAKVKKYIKVKHRKRIKSK